MTMPGGRVVLPTDAGFEHAAVPLDAPVRVGPQVVEPGWLALVPTGVDELPIETRGDRARMLGPRRGALPPETVEMWWNFVARSREEIEAAWRDWQEQTDRFGEVPSQLDRIDAPRPPWLPVRE